MIIRIFFPFRFSKIILHYIIYSPNVFFKHKNVKKDLALRRGLLKLSDLDTLLVVLNLLQIGVVMSGYMTRKGQDLLVDVVNNWIGVGVEEDL